MLFVLTLLASFNATSSASLRTETLALAPGARAALVRVHSDGVITVALCPLDRHGPAHFTFESVGSLSGCRPGAHRIPDTAAARARFDHEFEGLVQKVVNDAARRKSPKRIALQTLVVGVATTAVAYGLGPGPRAIGALTRRELFGVAAIAGYFGASGAALVGMVHGLRAGQLSESAANAAADWSSAREAATPLLINGWRTFATVVDMIDEAMARAGEIDPSFVR